jgi:hypothetical protein
VSLSRHDMRSTVVTAHSHFNPKGCTAAKQGMLVQPPGAVMLKRAALRQAVADPQGCAHAGCLGPTPSSQPGICCNQRLCAALCIDAYAKRCASLHAAAASMAQRNRWAEPTYQRSSLSAASTNPSYYHCLALIITVGIIRNSFTAAGTQVPQSRRATHNTKPLVALPNVEPWRDVLCMPQKLVLSSACKHTHP